MSYKNYNIPYSIYKYYMNENDLFKQYKRKQKLINEVRALDVNEFMEIYKNKLLRGIRQQVYKFLDMVRDGKRVPKVMKVFIPNMMINLTYSNKPVRTKGLLAKIYFDTRLVFNDFEKEKGKGKGQLYADNGGDLNPGYHGELDPVPLMLNIPILYGPQFAQQNGRYYSLDFKGIVDDFATTFDTDEEIVDGIMEEYFGPVFREAISHELTHFVQANNFHLDGTENAKEYDAEKVIKTGEYDVDELEVEARLHQKMPEYVGIIQGTRLTTPLVRRIVNRIFANQFIFLPTKLKHKYFSMVLKLCQAIKTTPGLTRANYNTPEMRRALQDRL